MENNYILQNEITVQEMIDRYKQRERQIESMQISENMALEDMTAMMEYCEAKQFLTKAGDALEFVSASAISIDGNTVRIIDKDTYESSLAVLSANNDRQYMNLVYSADLSAMEAEDRLFRGEKVQLTIETVNPNGLIVSDIATVAMLKNEVARMHEVMHELGIYKDERMGIRDQTLDVVFSEYEEIKSRQSLEIVESNDGYVMATNATPELLKNNAGLEAEFNERVSADNEVIHYEAPRETTVDMSKVGGNVKYEQYDDIGSVEKRRGVKTYEEKQNDADEKKNNAEKKSSRKQYSYSR